MVSDGYQETGDDSIDRFHRKQKDKTQIMLEPNEYPGIGWRPKPNGFPKVKAYEDFVKSLKVDTSRVTGEMLDVMKNEDNVDASNRLILKILRGGQK